MTAKRDFETDASSKWIDIDVWDEMRSSSNARSRKNRPPKTWASTHGTAETSEIGVRKPLQRSARSEKTTGPYQWKITPKQAAKEAHLQELERGLQFYTHTSPAGPPLAAGSSFLLPISKPSASSPTPDATNSGEETALRLKTPMLAYTADYDEANDLLSCLGTGPMGLDLEWNFSRTRGAHRTALLQICSPSLILIIHLSAMSHRIPPLLKNILQDPTIIKTGVAIKNDALKLQRDYAINTRNALELSNLVKLAQPAKWANVNHLISLRDLTRIYLGKRLKKDSVRVSDWERYPLEKEQIEYAASDTFASLEVLRAVSEYFRGPQTQEQQQQGDRSILEQLAQVLENADGTPKKPPMELDQALKLSAYDLFQERMQLNASEQHKQSLRTALREIQPSAPPQPSSSAPSKPHTAANRINTSIRRDSSNSSSDDDDGITVTRVHLAHERAMHRWLYSSQTLTEIALAGNIKVNTVARYIVKAMVEAKTQTSSGSDDGSKLSSAEDKETAERTAEGLFGDFTSEDRLRMDRELGEVGWPARVERSRYRVLAKSLGWVEVLSQGGSSSGSDKEDLAERARSPQRKGTSNLPQSKKRSSSPIVVEDSDLDEVDVVDASR